MDDLQKAFFDVLPIKFQRKEAIEIGTTYRLSERTVDNLLKACLGIHLT
jgi:Holliday junction resolvase RusA-like endonuclease